MIELVSAALVALGVGLLVAACVLRLVHGSWARTQAVAFVHEGHPYLRWHDHRYRIVEALWSSGASRRGTTTPGSSFPEPGTDVTIHYHVRRPGRWSLDAPYRGIRVIAVVGLVAAAGGALLGFLPA